MVHKLVSDISFKRNIFKDNLKYKMIHKWVYKVNE